MKFGVKIGAVIVRPIHNYTKMPDICPSTSAWRDLPYTTQFADLPFNSRAFALGILICIYQSVMRTDINIDDDLMLDALKAGGFKTEKEAIEKESFAQKNGYLNPIAKEEKSGSVNRRRFLLRRLDGEHLVK